MNIATTTAPAAANAASEMSTETKWVIIGVALLAIVALVYRFKLAAAIPLALASAGITWVSFGHGLDGVNALVTGIFAVLTVGVLFLGVHARNRAAAKAANAAPAPAHA